ncbi:hypothetical protein BCR42DRAFT_451234 [Absidia repens]|uniref:Uncharacterized protein n=1 Tax=Absidia repens TaxID=90262 RepID=A0A1X2IGJ5_9FUNG|nr:hypothetical protein BCR42DRAFT_451234 [Absidia repens]
MVITEIISNYNRCKIGTKFMNHQHEPNSTSNSTVSKLSRFFKKIAHPVFSSPHHRHRHPLKRPSMAQMNPSIFQSDSQISIIDHSPGPDKDKMYERRRYQQRSKILHQNEKLPSSSSVIDPDCFIKRRPSLTTSPSLDEVLRYHPSLPSSDRNSTINANLHSDSNSISTDYIHDKYTIGGYSTKHGNNDDGDNFEGNSHEHDDSASGSDRVLLEQQSPGPSRHSQSILSIKHLSPVIISDDRMTTPPAQYHAPWILQELRRINTISNDSPAKATCQHQTSPLSSSSLQRNRSYVIRKGRFEISIEPSD